MLHPNPDLSEIVINPDLHTYITEIQISLINIKETRNEFIKWWNYDKNEASEVSRNCRNSFSVRDDIIRKSFKYTIIIQLYAIIKDNQSKCLDKIYSNFKKSSHSKFFESIYNPLWDEYKNHHKTDIERLIINRNNYYGHLSKKQPIHNLLEQGNSAGVRLNRIKEAKYWLIEYDDICSEMKIFSFDSLNYLSNLVAIINFSNIPDAGVYNSFVNNVDKHLSDFRKKNRLE